jgi:protein O-GlcNAc transferase
MSIQEALQLHHAGRLGEAEAVYRKVLAAQPNQYHALHFLGVLRAQLGDMQGSLELVGRSLQLNPNDALAQFHMGEAQRNLKRHGEAVESYRRCVALKPDFAEAHGALAGVLVALKRWREALEAGERALALKPDFFEAGLHRARALEELQRLDEALAACDRTVMLQPGRAESHNSRGSVLVKLGRHAEALAAFDQALALDPGSVAALCNRASMLQELDRTDEALAAFQQALAADPNLATTYYNLGSLLLVLHRWQEAVEAFHSAVALKPDYAEAYYNCGNALWNLDRKEECLAQCERALAIDPNLGLAASRHFFDKACFCDWHERELEVENLKRLCREERRVDPFVILSAFDDPELHLKAARLTAGHAKPPVFKTQAVPHDRLRIAYISPDFRNHAVGLQIVEMLEHHDRKRFALYGVCLQTEADSPIRLRLKNAFEHFVEAGTRSTGGLVSLLREWEIDIAVDLGGYTGLARTVALACRPAPLAVSYLGYAGTLGADYVDYLLADAVAVPPQCERFYSEKIVRLPHCFFPTDTIDRGLAPRPTRAAAGLPEKSFVFCTFNNSYKITPELFDIWMRLLAAVEDSVLWLRVELPAARNNLRWEAEQRGVSAHRLIFAERAERGAHMARIPLADLFLDSTPYNAHTTCNDALWAGLPVLTCPGRSFASRAAASMLTVAGTEELIVPDLKAYEALALALARNPERLAGLRNKLSGRDHPLFDMAALSRAIETAYQTMWQRHVSGQKPESFSVNIAP